ncbi:MAG: ketopantoate reductase family protein [Anaerovoracaceae bacterium]
MRIGIIGAGAMGSLFGAKLSENEKDEIIFIDPFEEQVNAINNSGLLIEEIAKTSSGENAGQYRKYGEKGNISAVLSSKDIEPVDLAIIFVKSTFTEIAIKENLEVLGDSGKVLTLQNGLGNVEILKKYLNDNRVLAGTTAQGATMIKPGVIKHGGNGLTVIGGTEVKSNNKQKSEKVKNIEKEIYKQTDNSKNEILLAIETRLNKVGIETKISENVESLIWDKLIVNVGVNAITALNNITNGEIPENPKLLEQLKSAVTEAAEVANAKGITLTHADPIAHTIEVCKATGKNRSSMLQDVSAGRKTEIDMINGAIVREGKALGISTSVNEELTRKINELTEK